MSSPLLATAGSSWSASSAMPPKWTASNCPAALPLEAAKRELMEETGYGGGTWTKLMTIYANPGSLNNPTHCFLAEGVEKLSAPKLDATEELTVELMSREQVFSLLSNNQLIQALMIAPLWKYFADTSKKIPNPE